MPQQGVGLAQQGLRLGIDRRGIGKVIPLLGKIDRGFEPCDEIEELSVDLADGLRQRPLELVEGHTGLQRGDRLDQIGHCFRLHEIYPPVEKRPQRELPRFCLPRPCVYRRVDDLVEEHRCSVRADLDDIFAGVRTWSGERSGHHTVKGC